MMVSGAADRKKEKKLLHFFPAKQSFLHFLLQKVDKMLSKLCQSLEGGKIRKKTVALASCRQKSPILTNPVADWLILKCELGDLLIYF